MVTTRTSEAGAGARVLGLLVAYRLVVYLGGLAAIAATTALPSSLGYEVPRGVRTAVVVVTLGLMVLTYVGEWRVGEAQRTGEAAGRTAGEYPRGMRAALAGAVFGVAAGVYVAVEVSLVAGVLFVLGALLFGRLAYGRDWGDA